jgi:signal transduction histidine kinase
VAVLHDITPLKDIDHLKSDFVSAVSHDLLSPLTFMLGYANMLPLVGEVNEQQEEYIEKILKGIEQVKSLVDDLLDLGRIEAGVQIESGEIDIKLLLSEILAQYRHHARANGIKLQVEIAPGVPFVLGDMKLIRRALVNLLTNGFKYAPHSGIMMMKAELVADEVIFSVRDHGPGIGQEDQMRLFEKFFRGRQRGDEIVKGAGLGLAIVKSIAERHGGRAWCESEVGKGSTFYFSLPLESV